MVVASLTAYTCQILMGYKEVAFETFTTYHVKEYRCSEESYIEWAKEGHPEKWLSILDGARVRLRFNTIFLMEIHHVPSQSQGIK